MLHPHVVIAPPFSHGVTPPFGASDVLTGCRVQDAKEKAGQLERFESRTIFGADSESSSQSPRKKARTVSEGAKAVLANYGQTPAAQGTVSRCR
jgi:hypothetical protein